MPHDTEARLSATLQGIVGDRPYAPDLEQIESRGRKLRHRRLAWRATAGTGFAAAVAAVAVLTTGTQAPSPNLAAPNSAATSATAENAPLMHLVGYLTTAPQPEGDATLVLRDQVYTDGLKVDVWDLFADNGDLYFAKTRGALPARVQGKHAEGGGDDEAGRKKAVAAAEYAAKGDLNEARKRMALAYVKDPKTAPTLSAPGVKPSGPAIDKKLKITGGDPANSGNLTDNWVWGNSLDALKAGAGSPTVRAGVLRLLGQMPDVRVERGTVDGQAVLTLAAGPAISGGGIDSLIINAETGLPIKYVGESVGVTVNYTVTRVTLADVANGRF
ncbi:hypothetical protein [Micromonospora sp. NPDC049301]|uniref:hypothetical protein n=1 Tax=Micromonospora sp. NPDC049301 TaxID=3155723 RepID=UPI0034344878